MRARTEMRLVDGSVQNSGLTDRIRVLGISFLGWAQPMKSPCET